MEKKLVIEVHVGKRYGVSRLNCDEAGQVKDVVIDNERYNRISSQSKKRVWREHMEECIERMEHVYRTRAIKDILIKKFSAIENPFFQENAFEIADYIVKNIVASADAMDDARNITKQIMIFTDYDIQDIVDCFCRLIPDKEALEKLKKETEKEAAEEKKSKSKKKDEAEKKDNTKNKIINSIKAILPMRPYGIECSLFGRMTTSKVMENVDSAVCVNHSYSFGKATMDSDYFITVDNYLSAKENETENGQSGAGYLDSKDFATHVYYEYASIDVGQFYRNLCKGVDMEKESNRLRVKEVMIETLKCLIADVVCAAPTGGQNSFASFPDPVGVYITVRDSGTNRTADTCCIKELQISDYKKTEDEKFLSAMENFTNNDFSALTDYVEKFYIGEGAERMSGTEHKTLKETIELLGEIVDERF